MCLLESYLIVYYKYLPTFQVLSSSLYFLLRPVINWLACCLHIVKRRSRRDFAKESNLQCLFCLVSLKKSMLRILEDMKTARPIAFLFIPFFDKDLLAALCMMIGILYFQFWIQLERYSFSGLSRTTISRFKFIRLSIASYKPELLL
jgi:hypothetical protein